MLLRGKATVSSVGQSLIINAKPGCELEAQHVLGQLICRTLLQEHREYES